jgi:hypothetical protein
MNKDGSTQVTHSHTYAADSPYYPSTNLLCVLLMLHEPTNLGSKNCATIVNEISQPCFILGLISEDMSF